MGTAAGIQLYPYDILSYYTVCNHVRIRYRLVPCRAPRKTTERPVERDLIDVRVRVTLGCLRPDVRATGTPDGTRES